MPLRVSAFSRRSRERVGIPAAAACGSMSFRVTVPVFSTSRMNLSVPLLRVKLAPPGENTSTRPLARLPIRTPNEWIASHHRDLSCETTSSPLVFDSVS